ncbi:glyceraldehyde-3-phosphate ketol-isomerase [Lasius niger]|uniref:Glyceraldehyde-3-phosphate ketol-isomerase n=1 Tax=Lasius niger TaxID=67767 RepID=A0A0J7JTA4_LASNI|nr:glyceraldehyde-3-phosphate ketol-isomerase [Lasius niger]
MQTVSCICIAVTGCSTLLRGVTKRLCDDAHKNISLYYLTKNKFNTVKQRYEAALVDGDVDHDEFLKIISEYREYEKSREEILNKYNR